ncbi:MAG: transporter substrate-binding domain-containing protein [Verrucomicrobiales bacterium]|nr:transporter substrate-binding domain-containing protein [Verrucomicrobiales bacterium]
MPSLRWHRWACVLGLGGVLLPAGQGGAADSGLGGDGRSSGGSAMPPGIPQIRVGVRERPPVVVAGDRPEEWGGLGLDVLRLLGARLGMSLQILPFRSRSELLDAARNREVDLLLTVDDRPDRRSYLDFSPPYYERRQVVVTRGGDVPGSDGLGGFAGRRVAVAPSVSNLTALREAYPEIRFHLVPSETAALEQTATGDHAAALLEFTEGDSSRPGILPKGLVVAGETPFTIRCSFASRNDWPEFSRRLRQALEDLTPAEVSGLRAPYLDASPRGFKAWLRDWRVGLGLGVLAVAGLGIRFRRRLVLYFAGSVRRNLVLVVLAGMTPALAITLFLGEEHRGALVHTGERAAVDLVDRTADKLLRVAQHIDVILETTGRNPGLEAVGRTEFVTRAGHLLESMKMLDMFVFDSSGEVVAAGKPGVAGANVSKSAYFREAMRTRGAVVGEAVMSTTYGYPMLHFARPLPGPADGAPWFVSKVVQLDTLGLEFDAAKAPEGARITVVDREEVRLYEHPPRESGGLSGVPLGPEYAGTPHGSVDRRVALRLITEGAPRVIAQRSLDLPASGEPYISVIAEVPLGPLQDASAAFERRNLLALFCGLLLGLLIAIPLGNSLMATVLDRIGLATRRIGRGELGARVGVPATQKGDLAALGRAIDKMAESLDQEEAKRALMVQALQASLEEKTSLLKEVHHRVKNNLQIVSSLVSLQAGKFTDPKVRAALAETRDRVRGMALLHETLYRAESFARLNFTAYVKRLCDEIAKVANPGTMARVLIETDLEEVALELEQAVPCGLLLNELVTNALKHAFPGDRTGRLRVSLQRVPAADSGSVGSPCLRLGVGDDGVGLPVGFDIRRTSSLGMRLVATLTDQLGGDWKVHSATVGVLHEITFTPKPGKPAPPVGRNPDRGPDAPSSDFERA